MLSICCWITQNILSHWRQRFAGWVVFLLGKEAILLSLKTLIRRQIEKEQFSEWPQLEEDNELSPKVRNDRRKNWTQSPRPRTSRRVLKSNLIISSKGPQQWVSPYKNLGHGVTYHLCGISSGRQIDTSELQSHTFFRKGHKDHWCVKIILAVI